MGRIQQTQIVSCLNTKTGERKVYTFLGLTYRESISYGWFFYGDKRRNFNDKILYTIVHPSEFEIMKDFPGCKEMLVKGILDRGEDIKCKNLYDFYEKIGYNRKTKKYS